jgi:hypothetical protein
MVKPPKMKREPNTILLILLFQKIKEVIDPVDCFDVIYSLPVTVMVFTPYIIS